MAAASKRRRNLEKSKKQITFSLQEKYFRKPTRTGRGMQDGKQKLSFCWSWWPASATSKKSEANLSQCCAKARHFIRTCDARNQSTRPRCTLNVFSKGKYQSSQVWLMHSNWASDVDNKKPQGQPSPYRSFITLSQHCLWPSVHGEKGTSRLPSTTGTDTQKLGTGSVQKHTKSHSHKLQRGILAYSLLSTCHKVRYSPQRASQRALETTFELFFTLLPSGSCHSLFFSNLGKTTLCREWPRNC